ncbi:IgGFc-binding protein-like [Ylistrum balloti]|uniref:IgGFc-binding protein-like n=1 Tax=Ylistrum balloti TaxID=509963 RepID=UPI002905D14C|nr:IgGFc-binding protein-like [Ylistrum balloti]
MDWKLEFIFILIKFTVSLGDVLDNRGYEFIIAFMENRPYPKNMELFVATFSGDIVNVTVSTPKYYGKYSVHRQFQLSRGRAEHVSINTKLQMFGSTLSPKGILIQATDEIIVYGVNRRADSVDAFLGLPTDVLGGEYYAVSFLPTEKRSHSKHYAQLLVVANFEDTQVQITFPESDDFSNVTFDGNEYDGGETLAITMNRCEALQLQINGYGDMTGAYLQSDKPVAFFSGNARTVVGNGYTSDHLVEQLISTDRWGKQFVVVPVPGRDVGDYLKVVGYIGSTEIDIKCISNNPINTSVRIVLAKAGSYQLLEMEPRSYCYIVSNNSIFVVYIVKSRQQNDFHDPSMIMIPPMEQYAPEYVFTTIRLVNGMYKNYFLFVVEQENKDGLRLDGMPFPADTDYVSIPNTTLVAGYVMVGEGFHRFYHMSPISVFGGILYGQYSFESYGLPVGLRMAEINKADGAWMVRLTVLTVVEDIQHIPETVLLGARKKSQFKNTNNIAFPKTRTIAEMPVPGPSYASRAVGITTVEVRNAATKTCDSDTETDMACCIKAFFKTVIATTTIAIKTESEPSIPINKLPGLKK